MGPRAGGRPVPADVSAVFRLLARVPTLVASFAQSGVSSPEAYTWARRIGLVGASVDAELFAEVARNLTRLDIDRTLQTLAEMEHAT